MLIKWNGDGMMGTPLVNPAVRSQGGEKTVLFAPGWNEIPDEHFELLKDTFKSDIENNRIELYCKKEKVKSKTIDPETGKEVEIETEKYVGQPLRDVRADTARKIVAETFNLTTLRAWAVDPKMDRDLRYYIEKQIDACNAGGQIEE